MEYMNKTYAAVFLLIAVAVSGCTQSGVKKENAREFDVMLKDFGFTPGTLTVNVGDTVIIHASAAAGEHEDGKLFHGLGIKEYGVETGPVLSGKTKTIEFIADRPGFFEIECSEFCGVGIDGKGHEDMIGWLVVEETIDTSDNSQSAEQAAGSQDASKERIPEMDKDVIMDNSTVVGPEGHSISVEFPISVKQNKGFRVSSTLKDPEGNPLKGQHVVFYGISSVGVYVINNGVTDAGGLASVVHSIPYPGSSKITVLFKGDIEFGEINNSVVIKVKEDLSYLPENTRGPHSSIVPLWVKIIVASVALSIWSAYAFVIYQIHRIRKEGGEE